MLELLMMGMSLTDQEMREIKLVLSDGASGDNFGYAVTLSGDGSTALIGAYADDGVRGSAYVYTGL